VDSIDTQIAPFPTSGLRLHEPFLERASGNTDAIDGELGLGAFLTLRLVDQLCVNGFNSATAAVEYQCSATLRFVEGISTTTHRAAMLREIAVVAAEAVRVEEPRLLFAPLLAFAYCLEEELHLDEALDVLDTAMRLSDGRDADQDISTLLQRGRVLRNLGNFGEARTAYENAGAMALNLGDKHSELLSRIGRGVLSRFLGNLPESDSTLRAVIADARENNDRDAEARACHDLAGTLHFAGRAAEAVSLAFRAYELYESPLQRAKALGDTGTILKELGQYAAAKHAQTLVLANELPADSRARTELECLDLAALTGDRLTFERYRKSLSAQSETLLPEVRLDFELKLGVGLSQFAEHQQAETHLGQAIKLAEQFGMAERIFYAEQQLEEAQQRRTRPASFVPRAPISTDADGSKPVQETVARLETMVIREPV